MTWPLFTTWPIVSTTRRWDDGLTWRSRLVTAPAQEPIDLEYVREAVLRVVNGNVDNEYIGRQIVAARQVFEAETGRAAMEQTWQLILSGFPSGAIELPRPPLIAVTSVEYLDADDDAQTLSGSPAEYRVLPSGQFTAGKLLPLAGASWPSTSGEADAVTITYTAGYVTAEEMPELYKAGMGLLVEELYKNRGLSMASGRSKSMLDTSRFWRRVF